MLLTRNDPLIALTPAPPSEAACRCSNGGLAQYGNKLGGLSSNVRLSPLTHLSFLRANGDTRANSPQHKLPFPTSLL